MEGQQCLGGDHGRLVTGRIVHNECQYCVVEYTGTTCKGTVTSKSSESKKSSAAHTPEIQMRRHRKNG